MAQWKLRGCPRCRGDVYVEKDNEETNERCLQCGYVKQIGAGFTRKIERQPIEEKKKVAVGIS